jgi:hypothetical protein
LVAAFAATCAAWWADIRRRCSATTTSHAVSLARATAVKQHTVQLDDSQLPDGKLQQSWQDNWKKYHVAHRQASQQESPDSAVYDLPIESPGALPEAVSRSEQREGWKKFHTRVGTTRSMRLHVCACCERGQFDTRMHSGLFTINTLERTVQGLPAPGMERQSSWSHLIDEHRKAAGSVGWTKDAWDGAEEPSEACQLWLKGSKPRIQSAERALAREFGMLEGWSDRARRLKDPDVSAAIWKRLRTSTDGRPSTTFLGYQLQVDAIVDEDRLNRDNFTDEATMANCCRFRLCTECHSALCLGKAPAMPKNAIANGNNTAVNLWQSHGHRECTDRFLLYAHLIDVR